MDNIGQGLAVLDDIVEDGGPLALPFGTVGLDGGLLFVLVQIGIGLTRDMLAALHIGVQLMGQFLVAVTLKFPLGGLVGTDIGKQLAFGTLDIASSGDKSHIFIRHFCFLL